MQIIGTELKQGNMCKASSKALNSPDQRSMRRYEDNRIVDRVAGQDAD